MNVTDIPNFERLTDLERLELAEELIASVRNPEALPVPLAHRLELERRWAEFERNPAGALSPQQFWANVQALKFVSRELVFLPEVSGDFADAFYYYETLSPGCGGVRFETAFKVVLQQVGADVVTHLKVFEHFHRVLIPGFPYTLYYRLDKDKVVVTAILYSRFDPKRIEGNLRKRG